MKSFREMFAERLTYYMDRDGLTQQELADRLGVSRTSVSFWKSGQKVPRVEIVDKMCKIFGCTRADLVDPSPPEVSRQRRLMAYYEMLNPAGQDRLLSAAEEISEIPKYKNGPG